MCGIAGIISFDDLFHVTAVQLSLLSDKIQHRGPDGKGVYLNHQKQATAVLPQVGLVHRRLAILDLDDRAAQPMKDSLGNYIVFNGEIYNFKELKNELAQLDPSIHWTTTGDTEVILHAYARWGKDFVDHLTGMFAIALWDEKNQQLVLARDRMGQKPIYVAYVSPGDTTSRGQMPLHPKEQIAAVAFASDISALLTIPWINREIEVDALVEYLHWGYLPSPLTMYQGIWRLKPAELVTISRFGGLSTTYFDPNAQDAVGNSLGVGNNDPVAQTRKQILAVVEQQMVSDVPVGSFLSGGIDSSIITAAMVAGNKQEHRIQTFSIGFDDPRYDESAYAARVAKHLDTDHHEFHVHADAASDLQQVAKAFGEPFGDSSALPTFYLSRETRAFVKVALSGDGGDELFAGYDRYRAMAIGKVLRTLSTPLPWKILSPLAKLIPGNHPKGTLARLKRLLVPMGLPPARRYSSYVRLFDDALLRQLLLPEVRDYFWLEFDRISTHYEAALANLNQVEAAMSVDRLFYLPDDLLTKVDRCSMQFALEVRSPLMDHQLVRFASQQSSPVHRSNGPKTLLRKAFANDLPVEVFNRPKMGFAVPIGDWFKDSLNGMVRDMLLASDSFSAAHFNLETIQSMISDHENNLADHTQRLYALLMLELWYKNQ